MSFCSFCKSSGVFFCYPGVLVHITVFWFQSETAAGSRTCGVSGACRTYDSCLTAERAAACFHFSSSSTRWDSCEEGWRGGGFPTYGDSSIFTFTVLSVVLLLCFLSPSGCGASSQRSVRLKKTKTLNVTHLTLHAEMDLTSDYKSSYCPELIKSILPLLLFKKKRSEKLSRSSFSLQLGQ